MLRVIYHLGIVSLFVGSSAAGLSPSSLNEALNILLRSDGQYEVLCQDGSLETISADELQGNNLCPNSRKTARDLGIVSVHKLPDGTFQVLCRDLSSRTVSLNEILGGTACLSQKIDVLFVVDNSGSMQQVQQMLVNSVSDLASTIETNALDFQAAVTTTEAYLSHFGDTNDSDFRHKNGDPAIVTKDSPDWEKVLGNNILVGTNGSADERPFMSMIESLEDPDNSGFLRKDAKLHVIIITDEDDSSHDGSQFETDPAQLHSIETYVEKLDKVTGSTQTVKKYKVHAFAIYKQDCSLSVSKRAERVKQLVDMTNGYFGELCEGIDWEQVFLPSISSH